MYMHEGIQKYLLVHVHAYVHLFTNNHCIEMHDLLTSPPISQELVHSSP